MWIKALETRRIAEDGLPRLMEEGQLMNLGDMAARAAIRNRWAVEASLQEISDNLKQCQREFDEYEVSK